MTMIRDILVADNLSVLINLQINEYYIIIMIMHDATKM